MPHVSSSGADIWWEAQGDGPPLLLINGLSSASEAWFRLLPHVSADFRVITMDNRGVGRSSTPRGRYTITQMADDAARVLDAAGVDSAHVVGISMGSIIAQELMLNAPHRVRSAVLAASNPGGRHSTFPGRRPLMLVATCWARNYASFYRELLPYVYHPLTDPQRIEEDISHSRSHATRGRGLRGQVFGAMGWDRFDDLPRISAPVLVLHGADDLLDPVANAHRLADRIPGAQLVVLEDASHQVFTDQEWAAADAVRAHLLALV
jgi:3-oxoadipate enol-lactonase